MKGGFKLTGLHLIMFLLGSIILFITFRPIMEGFGDKNEQDKKQTEENENAMRDKMANPESQMHTMLSALTDQAEILMYGHAYNTGAPAGAPIGASAGTSTGALTGAPAGARAGALTGALTGAPAGALTVAGTSAGTLALAAGKAQVQSQTGVPPNHFMQLLSEKTGNLFNGNKQASYIGPAGDTVIVDNPRQPMQQQQHMGIPKSQIPDGNEDMYILKSQVVPPVCPACPNTSACPRPAPYPPCPPCARCPEPSFDCKKIPNYRNGSENTYLPRPVLANFSQFGM